MREGVGTYTRNPVLGCNEDLRGYVSIFLSPRKCPRIPDQQSTRHAQSSRRWGAFQCMSVFSRVFQGRGCSCFGVGRVSGAEVCEWIAEISVVVDGMDKSLVQLGLQFFSVHARSVFSGQVHATATLPSHAIPTMARKNMTTLNTAWDSSHSFLLRLRVILTLLLSLLSRMASLVVVVSPLEDVVVCSMYSMSPSTATGLLPYRVLVTGFGSCAAYGGGGFVGNKILSVSRYTTCSSSIGSRSTRLVAA